MAASLAEILACVVREVGFEGSFAVIGAFARNAWAPPRATTDLDLAVAADAQVLDRVEQALLGLGFRRVRAQRLDPADPAPDLLVFRAEGAGGLGQVDLLVAKTDFEQQVLERAVRIDLSGTPVPIATPEDLVVYKLIADRPRDRDDIEAIVRTRSRAAAAGIDWSHVERWAEYWGISERLAALRSRLER